MEERFSKEWQKLTQTIAGRHFVLAISGGVDSVVLAKLLAGLKVSFSLAHCNFKLRGTASDDDEQFVRELAEELGVDLQVKTFATADYAVEQGVSIQMAARELRYQWFEELMKAKDSFLITAHHANDVAETMLFNLTKGTGLAGLQGIQKHDGYKIRPMLWATKADILAFAKLHNLSWKEDASNTDSKYARNRLRNEVIPELEMINPSFIQASARTAKRLAGINDLLDHLIEELELKRWEGEHLFINKLKLKNLPGNLSLLHRIVGAYGFNFDQVEAVLNSIDTVGALFESNLATLNIDRQELLLSPRKTDQIPVQILEDSEKFTLGGNLYECRKIPRAEYVIKDDARISAFDCEKLKFPLIARPYKQGERFQPLGMQGKKLISDFLIDEKVPLNLKKEQLILESAGKIICLLGKRIDERYKISPSTNTVFEVGLEAKE